MWDGGDAWIIGGGSSLPEQFGVPESLINKVMKKELPKSAYSPYYEAIHDKHVIGTNLAYKLGDWVSVLYFADASWYRNNMNALTTFKNLKVTDVRRVKNRPPTEAENHKNIKKLVRSNDEGLSTDPEVLNWNKNSGAAAINLAVLFGATRILLLGFDMKPNGAGATHWHAGDPCYLKPTRARNFERFQSRFPRIAEDAKELGVEILNVNENSAINEFEKVHIKEVL
jgi:hypothetical protein